MAVMTEALVRVRSMVMVMEVWEAAVAMRSVSNGGGDEEIK